MSEPHLERQLRGIIYFFLVLAVVGTVLAAVLAQP